MAWRGVVGKFVQIEEFRAHVDGLAWPSWRPSFVVVHNTSAPALKTYADWRAHPEKHGGWNPAQWSRNLESYYRGQGWNAGPHAFVCPDGILLFTPMTMQGTHSPAWNSRTIGIETVGEFQSEPFDGGVRTNLIAVLGIIHAKLGLIPEDYVRGVRGLHFHKEDPVTTHRECPGKNMVKAQLVADVDAFMRGENPSEHVHVSEAVHTAPTADLTSEELTSIKWAQGRLFDLGFLKDPKGRDHAADGIWGDKSKAACKAFQTSQRFNLVDGIPGPVTRLALKGKLG